MMQFDIAKQISFVGLRRTGFNSYECRYPVLLVAWLRKQGFAEKPIGLGEIARLSTSQAEVRVRKTGRVRVFGEAAPTVHDTLQTLIK